ncbi:MAG TPA: TIGR00341 family protein [Desulfobulbus sp.]|nr:TIGR00341 family protein [Desulfobulbus sp.]
MPAYPLPAAGRGRATEMAFQLVEVMLPLGRAGDIAELLHEIPLAGTWSDRLEDNVARVYLLVETGNVEAVLNILEDYLRPLPGSRALLLPLEAVIPRPVVAGVAEETGEGEEGSRQRISRQELYNDVSAGASLNGNYLAMVVLSAVIAAIGLVRSDMAIIVGAMVLAPLLLPNVAFALANTLGDAELGRNAIRTALAGVVLTLLTGVVIGLLVPVDPSIPALAARTRLGWSDLLLALVSGCAGVLALTGGGRLSLVGVMVAVALVPPLVTGGLMFGAGLYRLGLQACNLALANIICINLAGVVTFHLQGIRPSTWWEKNRARQASRRATLTWLVLLALLGLLLLL